MDTLFVSKVPDLAKWGQIRLEKHDKPRPHMCSLLEITVSRQDSNYDKILHEMSLSIASARLSQGLLGLWESAVQGKVRLAKIPQTAISRALRRGICRTNTGDPKKAPECNDEHFKGHLVEVLLYCLRVYLAKDKKRKEYPLVFEPARPKAISASPGIDLLEVGMTTNGHYFHIWECKGTDGNVQAALVKAATQLCDSEGTASQGFMEAHRSLIDSSIVKGDARLAQFIRTMPRKFFFSPPDTAKRVGGVVGTGSKYVQTCTDSFSKKVGGAVGKDHIHCQAVFMSIVNFPQFRNDVFDHLWNIF